MASRTRPAAAVGPAERHRQARPAGTEGEGEALEGDEQAGGGEARLRGGAAALDAQLHRHAEELERRAVGDAAGRRVDVLEVAAVADELAGERGHAAAERHAPAGGFRGIACAGNFCHGGADGPLLM